MFTATFYNISDPPNKLDKTLGTAVHASDCTPYKPVSLLHGTIILEYAAAIEGANYCEISGDGRRRYCYVTDVIKDTGSRCEVQLMDDPLMTYKDAILELPIYAQRSSKQGEEATQTGYNSMLFDGTIQLSSQRTYILKPFHTGTPPTPMQFVYPSDEYFLAVIG